MNDVTIKVSTEKLKTVSQEVETKIQQLERTLNDVGDAVSSCRSYWDGESPAAYIAAYKGKVDVIANAFRRFRENVTDLQSIAGVYEGTERTAVEVSQELRVDQIV